MFRSDKGKLIDSLKSIPPLVEVLIKLAVEMGHQNALLKSLVRSSEQLNSTLTSFMVHEDQRKMRSEMRESEQALSRTPTKADLIY